MIIPLSKQLIEFKTFSVHLFMLFAIITNFFVLFWTELNRIGSSVPSFSFFALLLHHYLQKSRSVLSTHINWKSKSKKQFQSIIWTNQYLAKYFPMEDRLLRLISKIDSMKSHMNNCKIWWFFYYNYLLCLIKKCSFRLNNLCSHTASNRTSNISYIAYSDVYYINFFVLIAQYWKKN